MKKIFSHRLGRLASVGFLVGCLFLNSAVWAKDYKQCVVLGIEKPSNQIIGTGEQPDKVILDSKMLFFVKGDAFNVSVTNKCDTGKLYVTVQVPGSNATVNKYYHYLDTSGTFPTTALSQQKQAYSENFIKGAETRLWSFTIPETGLTFSGPVVFDAYLLDSSDKLFGFDSKTVYINFTPTP